MKKSIFLFFAAILCAIGMNATNLTGGEVVLLKPSTNWKKDGARFAVYFFNDAQGKNTWVSMTKASDETDIYYAVAPTGNWEKLIFCRMNPGASANGWDNKWNQSGNCTWTNTKSLLTVGSSWDSFTGTWSAKVVTSKGKLVASSANVSENEAVTLTPSLTTNTAINTILSTEYTISPATGASVSGNTFTATAAGEYTITATIKYRLNGYTSTSFESTATATTTITVASAAEPKHDVTVTWMSGATELKPSQTLSVGESTECSVEAPEFKDYTFSGWTLGSGVQSADENANPISITTKASGECTLVANYDYIEPVIKTIYCKMEYNWWTQASAAISAYISGTYGESTGVGSLMTLAPLEGNVWKIDVDVARYQKIRFIRVNPEGTSDWGARTGLVEIPTDGKNLYTITQSTDKWSGECSGTWSVYEAPATAPKRYITGSKELVGGEGWKANEIEMTYDNGTSTYSHTFLASTLTAGTEYKLKITEGNWDNSQWGTINGTIPGVSNDGDGNVCFTLKTAGDVTITFDGSKITVSTTGEFKVPVVYPYYILGTMNSWSVKEEYGLADEDEDGVYTREITLAAGEHFFKINIGKWDSQWGWSNVVGAYTEATDAKDDNKIKITLASEKTFVVEFNKSKNQITFDGLTEKVYKDITITIKANETAPKIHWWNAGDKLNDSEWDKLPEMTATANANEYSYTLKNVDAETGVEYLIKVGDLQSDNQKTKEDVTIDFRDICKVKVYGLNGWDKPYLLELADDYKTAKGTIVLEEKNYEFKMVEGSGDWLGNTGTIKKSESGWTFEKDKTNCKLQTKLAGNYIFTWDVTTNKLSVSYPVKVTPSVVENAYFSVADGKFVQFSTGNLQYEVGTNTWSFAANQYDYIGEANINVGDPAFTGKIDMFGWSADGKFGVNPSNKNEDYYGTFQDWGKLVDEADWYTLPADEWKYLLNTRPNAASLKQIAKIGDKLGIMLFPDAWTMPTDVNVTAEYDSYFKVNIYNYTLEQWTKLEEAGAVFLPAAGRRAGGYGNMINKEQVEETNSENLNGGHYKHYDNTNIYCYYWTSTINESKDVSYLHNIQALGGDEYTIGTGAVWGEKGRYGQSVRLVKAIEPNYTRTVTSGDYGTICLPNGGLLLGASAFSVAKMEGTTIFLDEVGTTMVGGTPYVVFPNTGASNLYVFYTDNVDAPAGNDKGLYGSYERRELEANVGNYIMLPGNKYAEVTGDRVYVAANRAYFKVSEISTTAPAPAPGVRRIAIGQAPQVATGMESVDASAQPVKMIIDGQLYILRGEKMYDAQGKLVK
ncbi:MAG: hypothetical protein UHJ11_03510 [Paludibacteraceae bacterium]|nr:hypothetical protein [Paludibacteraceae bacterium]